MDIEQIPFCTVNWDEVVPIEHPGETGRAVWRTFEMGNVRVRMVEYSVGYKANHWCNRGHVLLVLEGELITQLADGRIFTLKAGTSYQVATNFEPHLSSTSTGAKLFIVD